MPFACRGSQCAVVLLVLACCNRVLPLDLKTADGLFRELDGSDELYCRADLAIDGLVSENRWVDPHAGSVSNCLVGLERRQLLAVHCLNAADLNDPAPGWTHFCQGVEVSLKEHAARIVSGRLEILCGVVRRRVTSVDIAGDVAWVGFQTVFELSQGFNDGLESCRLVPAVLPESGTRLARWREKRWRLEPNSAR